MSKVNSYRRITIEIPLFSGSEDPSAGIRIVVDGQPEQLALPGVEPAGRTGKDSVGAFMSAWLVDRAGVPLLPVRSVVLFGAYCQWCRRNGVEHVAERLFSESAAKRPGVRRRTAHYGTGKNVAAFFFPTNVRRPPHLRQQAWLSECAEIFDKSKPRRPPRT